MKYRFLIGVCVIGVLTFLAACSTPGGSATQTTQPSTSPTGTQTVNVALFDDHITSSMMSFTVGDSYHFVVVNKGQLPYMFAMMSQDREQEMEHMSMLARSQAALHMSDTIASGQTMTFDYLFGSSMMGQHLEFVGYQQGGNQVHMRLPFTMQP